MSVLLGFGSDTDLMCCVLVSRPSREPGAQANFLEKNKCPAPHFTACNHKCIHIRTLAIIAYNSRTCARSHICSKCNKCLGPLAYLAGLQDDDRDSSSRLLLWIWERAPGIIGAHLL